MGIRRSNEDLRCRAETTYVKRALFISKNLIGDGLNTAPALIAWYKQHPDWEIDLWTLPDSIGGIYRHFGVPLHTIVREEDLRYPYDFEFKFDCGEAFKIGDTAQCHIAKAYAAMLQVQIPSNQLTFIPNEGPHNSGRVIISPFSASCSSRQGHPPNKMLSMKFWNIFLKRLRHLGKIAVLGGPTDGDPALEVSPEECFFGYPLNEVALMLRDCKLFVTIDNGMAHLGASQSAPMVLFYPACLGTHWILPWNSNPKFGWVQVDPATVPTLALAHFVSVIVNAELAGAAGGPPNGVDQ